jgi:EpsI family protein
MQAEAQSRRIPSGKKILIFGLLLAVQGLMLFALNVEETVPLAPNLNTVPSRFADWDLVGEEPLDAATEALLRPDLSLMRGYLSRSSREQASVFVGYFKTSQPNYPTPHSPTVCLPGAGWVNVFHRETALQNPLGQDFRANEYVLEKSGQRLSVVYWYQNSQRSWTDQAWGKIYTLPDFLRHHRTDVALVRITAMSNTENFERKLNLAKSLARDMHASMTKVFAATQ